MLAAVTIFNPISYFGSDAVRMVNKVNHKLLQQSSSVRSTGTSDSRRVDSPSSKETSVDLKDSNDVNSNELKVMLRIDSGDKGPNLKGGRGTRCQNVRLAVLIWLFVEKFVEFAVVFLLTLLALLWESLFQLLQILFWPLVGFCILSLVALIIWYRIAWFSHAPGCFLFKFFYVLLLTAIFFLLEVYLPKCLSGLSPYFAVVGSGTATATYLLLAFIAVTHKHLCKVNTRKIALCLYGLVVPVLVLVCSQLVYLCGGAGRGQAYGVFMTNIGLGLCVALPFSCETVYIYHNFATSINLEEFVKARGMLPGCVIAHFFQKAQETAENEYF